MSLSLKDILTILRWPNLLIAIILQLIFQFLFLAPEGQGDPALLFTPVELILVLLITSFIMAGGYIHNDIYGQQADHGNKPEKAEIFSRLSVNTWFRLYYFITAIAVSGILAMGFLTDDPKITVGLIIPFFALYLYDIRLQDFPIIGNVLIALLCAWVPGILLFGQWEWFIGMMPVDQYMSVIFPVFAFYTTWIREIFKDIEDIPGDRISGARTLPLTAGIRTAQIFSQILAAGLIVTLSMWAFVMVVDFADMYLIGWCTILLLFPLLYIIFKANRYTLSDSRINPSTLTKWYMVWGIFIFTLLRIAL